jgi:hypothetical protein
MRSAFTWCGKSTDSGTTRAADQRASSCAEASGTTHNRTATSADQPASHRTRSIGVATGCKSKQSSGHNNKLTHVSYSFPMTTLFGFHRTSRSPALWF